RCSQSRDAADRSASSSPSEGLHELDQRALVAIGQVGAEVVALVLDEVGARVELVEIGDERQEALRRLVAGEPLLLDVAQRYQGVVEQADEVRLLAQPARLGVGVGDESDRGPL